MRRGLPAFLGSQGGVSWGLHKNIQSQTSVPDGIGLSSGRAPGAEQTHGFPKQDPRPCALAGGAAPRERQHPDLW